MQYNKHLIPQMLIAAFITLTVMLSCDGKHNNQGSLSHDGKLSREIAADLLKSKYPILMYSDQLYFRSYEKGMQGYNDMLKLAQKGLVTLSITQQQTANGGKITDSYQAQLTNEGKKYMADSNFSDQIDKYARECKACLDKLFQAAYIRCITGKYEFGEITGIIEEPDATTATVDYTEIVGEITPAGEALGMLLSRGKSLTSRAKLIKYDDGWRLAPTSK